MPAFLKVVEIKEDVGYFLFDGMPKDLLLSKDDCTFEETEKPIVGDYLFVYLKINTGTFRAKLVPKNLYYDYLHPIGNLKEGEFYKVYDHIELMENYDFVVTAGPTIVEFCD